MPLRKPKSLWPICRALATTQWPDIVLEPALAQVVTRLIKWITATWTLKMAMCHGNTWVENASTTKNDGHKSIWPAKHGPRSWFWSRKLMNIADWGRLFTLVSNIKLFHGKLLYYQTQSLDASEVYVDMACDLIRKPKLIRKPVEK